LKLAVIVHMGWAIYAGILVPVNAQSGVLRRQFDAFLYKMKLSTLRRSKCV
jgi:hypothetical protein